jgi:Ca-activated chloride channel family protein
MLAQDLKPDRLTRAKLEIADLMTRLDGDEIGLVLFSGASFIQFPLTSDYSTARLFLDSASPTAISRQGTAIAEAIRTAMSGFDAHRSAQKVILLVTDGESHEGDALGAAQEAARQGARVFTLGIGSPQGEPIPEYDASGTLIGYKKDRSGQVVISRLDESALQSIARLGGGRYLRVRPDGSELDELMAELDKLQASQLETRFQTQKVERFQPFLLVAFLGLVVAELIPPRVNRRRPDW